MASSRVPDRTHGRFPLAREEEAAATCAMGLLPFSAAGIRLQGTVYRFLSV